jgi:peptide chain release factor 2
LKELEQQAADPDLWNDPDAARGLMQHLADLQEDVQYWTNLRQQIAEVQELLSLEDEELLPELEVEAAALEQEMGRAEFRLLLSGKHDRGNAILAIHAGAGGTDAQDWAAMVLRMFLRWTERRNFKTEILDSLDGESAGIKSTTFSIAVLMPTAIFVLSGVCIGWCVFHLLTRRTVGHTSFVLVEVWPDLGNDVDVQINH